MAISLPAAIARRTSRRRADAEFRSILIPVNADQELILLGATDTHRSGYRGLVRDTTARRVAAQAQVPVMFVRPAAEAA